MAITKVHPGRPLVRELDIRIDGRELCVRVHPGAIEFFLKGKPAETVGIDPGFLFRRGAREKAYRAQVENLRSAR